jgi:hypothetical protein
MSKSMKNFNKLLTLGLMSLTIISTGCGTAGSGNGSLPAIGTWKLPAPIQAGGVSVNMIIQVESNRVTITSACTISGTTGSATVTGASTLTDSAITTLEQKSAVTQVNGHPCTASIEKGVIPYTIVNGKLTFKNPTIESDEVMELVRQ